MDRIYHALKVLEYDPRLTMRLHPRDASCTPGTVSMSSNRFNLLDLRGHAHIALGFHEALGGIERILDGIAHVDLYRVLKFKDSCLTMSMESVTPIWDADL
jgi:hypothetical protein